MGDISPQNESLNDFMMQEAWWSTYDCMKIAVKCIDREFGEGFAKANPQFVGQFMISASIDGLRTFTTRKVRKGIRLARLNAIEENEQ